MAECPCGLGEEYMECCGRYIEQGEIPLSAETLMRSRYTAYVMKKADYLVATSLSTSTLEEIEASMRDIEFVSLEIVSKSRGKALDKKGRVEFKATFRNGEKVGVLHENSLFLKRKGRWLYDEKGSEIFHYPPTNNLDF